MSNILVKPPQLREYSMNLKASAKTVQSCIDAVDAAMMSLQGRFEGVSADEIRGRYLQVRERVQEFRPLIEKFGNELETTADRFERADKAIS